MNVTTFTWRPRRISAGTIALALALALPLGGLARWAVAQQATGEQPGETGTAATVALGESGFAMTPPANWQKQQPRSRIVAHEFAISSGNAETPNIRITIMQAGGGVEANVERWMKQFTQPDGSATQEKTKRDKRKVADQDVYLVDISGSFKDQPGGPFGPSTNRADYRMLAAIVQTKSGNFFIKMVGHQDLIADAEASFDAFVESLAKSSK